MTKTGQPEKHRFEMIENTLSDGSTTWDIIFRYRYPGFGDESCIISQEAISLGHAIAICDDLNKALELRGIYC